MRWWERGKVMDDPFRRQISYKKGEHEIELKKHIEASHKVLSECEVLILTLGLVEIWRDRRDNVTFWRTPPIGLYDPNIHQFHVMNETECLEDLIAVHSLLRKYNTKCKIILSVSPVTLRATFRTDVDPIAANVYSKATLRCAADVFSRMFDNVYYFPSFEFVTYGFDNPYQTRDNMHIKQSVIDTMMKYFERRYVK